MRSLARLCEVWASWWRPKTLGQRGERAAAKFLRRKGHVIIARGLRDQLGEVDLVTVDGRVVVFVEVKTRTTQHAGHPADAVDREKQHRLTRVALHYLKRHDLLDCATRFDIVAVTWPEGETRPFIEHFPGAFEASGRKSMFT